MAETIHPSDSWNEVTVYLGKQQEPFHLVIESIPEQHDDFIAIDDLSLLDCQEPSPNPNGCNDDMFSCSNGIRFKQVL